MATFFIFETVTREGALSVADAPERSKLVPDVAAGYGVRVLEWYFTLAEFDFIMKVEADDEKAVAAFALALRRSGNIRAEVISAYSPEEWTSMVGQITAQTHMAAPDQND